MVNLRQFNQVINMKITNKSKKKKKKKISKPKIQANDLKSKLLVIIQMKGCGINSWRGQSQKLPGRPPGTQPELSSEPSDHQPAKTDTTSS